jgi:protein-S-isoprenylcysteine O-methyltransferase Ste14
MKDKSAIAIAGLGYLLAMANIGYLVGFLADVGVPKTINSGSFGGDIEGAVVVDVLLVLGFGLHHSVTARRWFKSWWTRFVPHELERSVYLYMTAAASALLVVAWQPIPITLWRVEAGWAVASIHAAFLGALLMMVAATFHFGHLGFFGLGQAWERYRARQPAPSRFSARYLYALVRHPISLGWMLVPWLTPHLTVGQAVFGLSVAAYVLVATFFEEADLVAEFGDRYRRYRREVPAFVPWLRLPRALKEAVRRARRREQPAKAR